MPENEYVLQYIARERLREAEARAALYSTLQESVPGGGSDRDRWRRLRLWWRATVARATHLPLPKSANRL